MEIAEDVYRNRYYIFLSGFVVLRSIAIIETVPSDSSRVGRQGRETNIKGTAVYFLENIRFS